MKEFNLGKSESKMLIEKQNIYKISDSMKGTQYFTVVNRKRVKVRRIIKWKCEKVNYSFKLINEIVLSKKKKLRMRILANMKITFESRMILIRWRNFYRYLN